MILLSEITIIYDYPESDAPEQETPCGVDLLDRDRELVGRIEGDAARGIGKLLECYQQAMKTL